MREYTPGNKLAVTYKSRITFLRRRIGWGLDRSVETAPTTTVRLRLSRLMTHDSRVDVDDAFLGPAPAAWTGVLGARRSRVGGPTRMSDYCVVRATRGQSGWDFWTAVDGSWRRRWRWDGGEKLKRESRRRDSRDGWTDGRVSGQGLTTARAGWPPRVGDVCIPRSRTAKRGEADVLARCYIDLVQAAAAAPPGGDGGTRGTGMLLRQYRRREGRAAVKVK